MTIVASGKISMSDIIAEFQGGNSLSAYYRGGANVPAIASTSGIPASGAISFSNFYGKDKGNHVNAAAWSNISSGGDFGTTNTVALSGMQYGIVVGYTMLTGAALFNIKMYKNGVYVPATSVSMVAGDTFRFDAQAIGYGASSGTLQVRNVTRDEAIDNISINLTAF